MACMCLIKLHVIKALSKLAPLYEKVLSGGILQMGTHPLQFIGQVTSMQFSVYRQEEGQRNSGK